MNHPALVSHAKERREKAENRVADLITGFAGSMKFVYVHIVWFSLWIVLGVEKYPFGLLTMIVSLESIFLSTFILISQNRADDKRQTVADYQWELVKSRDVQIDELLALIRDIHQQTWGAAHDERTPT
jgi:uncharacterized membrane protein